jgi:hypothetical protein
VLLQPAPFMFPNGTIYLGTRRTTSAEYPAWIGHVATPGGPWVPVKTQVISTPQASVTVSEEDSFIWQTQHGFHMLTHRAVSKSPDGWPPRPSTGCGGGHLFSHDLITWFVGGNAFGRSANASAQCDLQLRGHRGEPRGSATIRLTSRQRPTIFVAPNGDRFLFTGASGPQPNITEYQHSFTLVQQINV